MKDLAPDRLREMLGAVRGARLVVLGDVMLDRHVTGEVSRVSPEAPIPVLAASGEACSPGGAANVAEKAASLGASVALFGAVGRDDAGRELARLLAARGVDPSGLAECADRPTTVKTRFIARSQQMLRVDWEVRRGLSSEAAGRIAAAVESAIAAGAKALIIEDYGKGVLEGGTAERAIGVARKAGIPVVVDPTLCSYSRYRGATVITPNEAEARGALGLEGNAAPLAEVARALAEASGGASIAVTRGAEGITLFRSGKPLVHRPAHRVEVFDVTGAGDAVTAAYGVALASGVSIEEATDLANLAGGAVVTQLGPGTISPSRLMSTLAGGASSFGKMLDMREAAGWAAEARARGEKVIFTNGCFDILHAGHVKLLEEARRLGDRLVVGLNSDESVRRLKGPGRPVTALRERSAILAALDAVDAVVVFDEDTPERVIREVRPDVLVKGSDYSESEIVGAEFVKSCGGRVETVELMQGISTTELIRRLREDSR